MIVIRSKGELKALVEIVFGMADTSIIGMATGWDQYMYGRLYLCVAKLLGINPRKLEELDPYELLDMVKTLDPDLYALLTHILKETQELRDNDRIHNAHRYMYIYSNTALSSRKH